MLFLELCRSIYHIPVLALFRNNQSTTSLLLALYVGGLHLPALLGWAQPRVDAGIAGEGALYQALFGWAAAHSFFSALAAAALTFVQAVMINQLADTFRITEERNWLPGVLYALAASCLGDYWFLSPPQVAATFIPLALNRVFGVYKKPAATARIFDAGLWTAAASLFYPPAIWLLLVMFAGISTLRSFNLREQLVCLSGIFTPLFLAWTAFFWFDKGGEFWTIQVGSLFHIPEFDIHWMLETQLKAALGVLLLLVVLLSYGTYYRKKLIQVQKYINIHYWVLLVVALTSLLLPHGQLEHFYLSMSSIGMFLAMSIGAIRRPLIAEIIHLCAVAGVFLIYYLPGLDLSLPQLF